MKIGISLNEVVRDYLGQFHYVYEKYKGEVDFEYEDITSFDLLDSYKFEDKAELNQFLYRHCSLEVFGHADQTEPNIFVKLNNFIMDMEDEGEHEVYIVSREHNTSIPSTLFFLSKMLCKARNIRFVENYEDKWNDVDALITANPITLAAKPEGKIAFKIDAPYNKDVKGDFNIEKAENIFDVEAINKLLKIEI